MNMRKISIIMIAILLLCGCSKENIITYNFFSMDTAIQIKLYDVSKKESEEI